jgi:hypothetical protein
MLGMCRHAEASQDNDDSRDEVSLGATISLPTQPNADQPSTPPDDAHGRVLQVVTNPLAAPSVLREGVDAAPYSDGERVEELLTPAGPLEP